MKGCDLLWLTAGFLGLSQKNMYWGVRSSVEEQARGMVGLRCLIALVGPSGLLKSMITTWKRAKETFRCGVGSVTTTLPSV